MGGVIGVPFEVIVSMDLQMPEGVWQESERWTGRKVCDGKGV